MKAEIIERDQEGVRCDFVSYAQAEKLTGVSVRTLKRQTRLGLLPRYQFGGGRKGYVKRSDLLGLFEKAA